MIQITGVEEQMQVDRGCLRCLDTQAQFDVGKNEANLRKAPLLRELEHLHIAINTEVIRDSQCIQLRGSLLDSVEKAFPRISTAELIVQCSAWRMKMRIPSVPHRSANALRVELIHHYYPRILIFTT